MERTADECLRTTTRRGLTAAAGLTGPWFQARRELAGDACAFQLLDLSARLMVVADHRGPQVLVIEDDKGVRNSTVQILRESGYLVDQAAEGVEALAKLSAETFDAVVLDLALPRLDGIALLEAQYWPAPVIIVSALEYYDRDEVTAHLGEKIFAVLQKPVDPRYLLSTLASAIGSDRATP